MITALAIENGKIYWAQPDGIHRANLDGSDDERIVEHAEAPRAAAKFLASQSDQILASAELQRTSDRACLVNVAHTADGTQGVCELWFPNAHCSWNEDETLTVKRWLIEAKEKELARELGASTVRLLIQGDAAAAQIQTTPADPEGDIPF